MVPFLTEIMTNSMLCAVYGVTDMLLGKSNFVIFVQYLDFI